MTQDNADAETSALPFSASGELARNYVSVTTSGNSTATVAQQGDGNSAVLSILDGSGTVHQAGNGNTASLTVDNGTLGTITQTGNSNTAGLVVTGVAGSSATLTQTGNNLSSGSPTAPISVTTPYAGFPVAITQN